MEQRPIEDRSRGRRICSAACESRSRGVSCGRHVSVRAAHQRLLHANGVGGLDHWPSPRVLWLNTGVLVLSSVAMQWTRSCCTTGTDGRRENRPDCRGRFHLCFSGRTALGVAAIERLRLFSDSPIRPYAFLLSCSPRCTACTCWAACGSGAGPPPRCGAASEVGKVRLSVELCTVYWHFLLLVWLVLFALLLSGNDNLGILLISVGSSNETSYDATCADEIRRNPSRGLKVCKASSPTGPRTSGRSRRSPGARR